MWEICVEVQLNTNKLPYILDNKVGLIFNSRDFWTRLFSNHAYFLAMLIFKSDAEMAWL